MVTRLTSTAKVLAAFLAVPALLFANPAGEVIKHGAAEFVRGGNSLQILQGSEKLIIDWESFSISGGEVTDFVQPGARSIALNRVTGATMSQIDGLLKANGNVILVNPNGILIGPGGRVDVGGFIASTLDISDADFLAGGDVTFRGSSSAGKVVNLGTISARTGDVFLFGPTVENKGTITAPNGTIGLGAGTKVLLKASGDERVFVEGEGSVVNEGTIKANIAELKARNGNVYATAIRNSGRVIATGVTKSGGQIFLTGKGSRIVNSGTLKARKSDGSGGRVKIDAGGPAEGGSIELEAGSVIDAASENGVGGTVELMAQSLVINDGALVDASGETDGGTISVEAGDAQISGDLIATGQTGIGGTVTLEAQNLTLGDGAMVDVSGGAGGGSIFAGGGFQGNNPEISNAENTTVESGAALVANALNSGNAGSVIIWSDKTTTFDGRLEAQALGTPGDGGFAEISGKITLNFNSGDVVLGEGGFLLLDPSDFTIDAIVAANITTQLNFGTDVVVSTDPSGVGGNGDIFVNSDVIANPLSTGSLAILAGRNINVDSNVQIGGDLSIVGGWDGVTGYSGPPFGIVFGGAFDVSQIQATPGSFGLNGSDIQINPNLLGTGTSASLGSANGFTRLFGADLFLNSSSTNGADFARVGYATPGLDGGDIFVRMTGNVSLNSALSYSRIGNARSGPAAGASPPRNITLAINGNLSVTGSNVVAAPAGHAAIGHGTDISAGTLFGLNGDINVSTGGAIVISAGSGTGSVARIGHLSFADGDVSGNIRVSSNQSIFIGGGQGINAPAGIGHQTVDGNLTGDINDVSTASSLTLSGRSGTLSSASIGHFGTGDSAASGRIVVNTDQQIQLTGGVGMISGAQIGHTASTMSGQIEVDTSGDEVTLTGGTLGNGSVARIGHGDLIGYASSSASGAINLSTVFFSEAVLLGDVVLNGGTDGTLNGAMIGHGSDDSSGSISIVGEDITLTAGTDGSTNVARIGHGGSDGVGNGNGDIVIDARDVTLRLGGGFDELGNDAKIGHGPGNTGDVFGGNISLDVTNLDLESSLEIPPGQVTIGHGNILRRAASAASASGNIEIRAGENITTTVSQIGHGSLSSSGNVFLGVGQFDPTTAGSGTFTSDVNSVFTAEGGELRFYAADRGDVDIPIGTDLNGTPLANNSPFPNEQGFFLFGDGPYSSPFSFYFDGPPLGGEAAPVESTPPPPLQPLTIQQPVQRPTVDPTGFLLQEITVPAPGNDDFSPDYTVQNLFFEDSGTNSNVIRNPAVLFGGNGSSGSTGGGFAAIGQAGISVIQFDPATGFIVPSFGVIGFGENGAAIGQVPNEVANILQEQLGENSVLVGPPGGLIGPEAGMVAFAEKGPVFSTDLAGQNLIGGQLVLGAFNELGTAITGVPQSSELPDGTATPGTGAVVMSADGSITAETPPEEIARLLAEQLGEQSHDGTIRGPLLFLVFPNDGIAFFTETGGGFPEESPQEVDAIFQDTLGAGAAAELDGAISGGN